MTDTPEPTKNKKPIYTRPKFIASLIAGVIFLILIFQNWEPVTINVFFWKPTTKGAVLYLAFSLIGFVVGWLLKRPKSGSKPVK